MGGGVGGAAVRCAAVRQKRILARAGFSQATALTLASGDSGPCSNTHKVHPPNIPSSCISLPLLSY